MAGKCKLGSLARTRRRDRVRETSASSCGMLSRDQLLQLGVTRAELQAELRAERWKAHGRETIAVHTGPLDEEMMRWFAVIEAGPRAALDGVSALQAAGLKGFTADTVRVSVPRGARVVRRAGVTIRQTRRLRRSDVMPTGIPRVRPEIAAVRAALWARSDRQAALLLAMTVQQRLTTAEAIARALLDVRRDRRRKFLEATLLDILDGAQAISELDFTAECRRRGLPRPDRQAVRKGPDGRIYLDVIWERYRLVVEIDGAHHLRVEASIPDALRQNAVSLQDATVLRLPLLGLRVAADEFFAQIREALV
ncbi:MAG: hypothetical protein ACRDO8_08425, partial [Nocardioidaceae bacterium]